MAINNALAAERERLGWTQAEAGKAGGITRQSYAAIESGTSVPSTEVALRLARAMGRSVEDLFRLPETPVEAVSAVWAGDDPPTGRRVRLVRIMGRWVAFPTGEEERPSRQADGVVMGPVSPSATESATGAPMPDSMEESTGESRWDPGDPGQESPRTGELTVRVRLLSHRPPPADLAVVGCDPAFGIVAEALRRDRGVNVAWAARGSRAALEALSAGRAHVAGAHLHDPETGQSNEPWIREIVPFPCTRVGFAVWEEGLLVQSGNPEDIGGIPDLARPGVRLVNREPGSGSRLLLDEALETAGLPADGIQGYETAARGHLAVGEAISAGLADVGVGIRAAGAAFGLDVLPLRTEPYELIVPDRFLDLPAVQALLDALRLPGVRSQVEALQGYDGAGMGEAV